MKKIVVAIMASFGLVLAAMVAPVIATPAEALGSASKWCQGLVWARGETNSNAGATWLDNVCGNSGKVGVTLFAGSNCLTTVGMVYGEGSVAVKRGGTCAGTHYSPKVGNFYT